MYLLLRFPIEKVIGLKITAGKSVKNNRKKNLFNVFLILIINLILVFSSFKL